MLLGLNPGPLHSTTLSRRPIVVKAPVNKTNKVLTYVFLITIPSEGSLPQLVPGANEASKLLYTKAILKLSSRLAQGEVILMENLSLFQSVPIFFK